MVIRRAGLESLFPRGGRRGRKGRNFKSGRDLQRLIGEGLLDMKDWQTPATGWPTDINQFDFPGPALVAPPGIGLQQPTVVRAPAVGTQSEYMKPLPPGFKRFLQQPPPRPRIEEPGGPRPPRRPPGESVQAKIRALKMQQMQLQMQIAKIDAQIQSLLGGRKRWMDDLDFGPGGEPPRPILPRPPRGIPIGPPTMPDPGTPPPSIGPGTPIPQPPTAPTPWKPIPPWGG